VDHGTRRETARDSWSRRLARQLVGANIAPRHKPFVVLLPDGVPATVGGAIDELSTSDEIAC